MASNRVNVNSRFLSFLQQSTLARASSVLSGRDRRKIYLITVIQVGMSILDLIGIALIGVIGALTVSGVQSQQPSNRVNGVLESLHLEGFQFQTQVAILGLTAAVFLVGRTILSMVFTRRTLLFLSLRGALISSSLIANLLRQPLLRIQEKTHQETLYAVTTGVNAIVLGVLATSVTLVADIALLVVIASGLLVVDPTIAIVSFLFFVTLAFLLFNLMKGKALKLGTESARLEIVSNSKVIEVLTTYRESVVHHRRNYYAREISDKRIEFARTQAEISFMPNISKYVIETALVLGLLLVSASQFMLQDAGQAVGTLAVFMAGASRIAPAVLRIQQGSLMIKGSIGVAEPTLLMIQEIDKDNLISDDPEVENFNHDGFEPNIRFESVSLQYPKSHLPALSGVSLSIPKDTVVAFVGPSGAGKTSLVDILLGILTPTDGYVEISGLAPLDAIEMWPGAISYVPQNVAIVKGTIKDNVALGFPGNLASEALVWNALNRSALATFVDNLPMGLESEVGEFGANLSGGQRQRLGIARALFTQPKLIVLDEATSAMDGETESDITDALLDLRGKSTVILIAHRLSTVREADLVVYMAEGKIMATGTFDEVRSKVPDFDRQAKLMGL
jgi:ATP-binding cassette, subfamily B, bacterial PglK